MFYRSAIEKTFGVSVDKPFFNHSDHQIFFMYDPPHLLKNIRNNLKSNGYREVLTDPDKDDRGKKPAAGEDPVDPPEATVRWQYIADFYAADSSLPIRMAPKLSRKHMDLPGFSKMRVRFAAQVLSHSVAAGIGTLCHLGSMKAEAMKTAEFVENMDRLFNVFNSSTKTSTRKMQHCLMEKSGHMTFLDESFIWLSTIKPMSKRKTLPCIEGWKLSIRSLQLIWKDLHTNHNVAFLFTNRLNQDCAENLFSVIRGKGGNRDNPDAREFRSALRQIMVEKVMIPSPKANCENDVDSFLFTLKSSGKQLSTFEAPTEVSSEIPESIRSLMAVFTPEQVLSLEEDNIITYIAGYIARKVSPKVCSQCEQMLCGKLNSANESHMLLKSKDYGDTKKGGLVVPSDSLVSICSKAENAYRENCEQILYQNNVRSRLISTITKTMTGDLLIACPEGSCSTLTIIVSLFVNVRLHHTLRDNNCEFTASTGKKNRKLLKLKHV